MTGEGLRVLVDPVDRGTVRVLDLAFVGKDEAGSVTAMAIADLDGDGKPDLATFEGASSGLLGKEDINEAGGALAPGRGRGSAAWWRAARRQRTNPVVGPGVHTGHVGVRRPNPSR